MGSYLLILIKLLLIVTHIGFSSQSGEEHTVDFIVVGGGIGGCTVAGRLSENGQHTVALLESGGFPDPRLEIPVMGSTLLTEPIPNKKTYATVPQKHANLDGGGVIPFTTGRGLGGGSAINAMAFNRGNPQDYDKWAQITQDPSWNYANMLPHFKSLEHYMGDYPSDQHGYGGPIPITKHGFEPDLDVLQQAGRELGYFVGDLNGPQRVGFSLFEFTKNTNGKRVSAYHGYIQPHLDSRSNLKVITNAYVTRIIFNGNRAIGVKYLHNFNGTEEMREIYCHKEIIVSAGVFESPALLMKSGIGPRNVLEQAGVPVLKELPVGQNLQDHVTVMLDFVINDTSKVFIRHRDLTLENFRRFNETGLGPYASWHGGNHSQAFLQTRLVSDSNESYAGGWPDILLEALNSPGIPLVLPARDNIVLKEGEVVSSAVVYLLRPKSAGSVTLNATNIDADPIIDFQYLSHPQDVETLVEGVKLVLKLYEETNAFKKVGAIFPSEPLESCSHLQFRSDEYWKCFIRAKASLGLHAGASCRMGQGSQDPRAVVDSALKVIGMEGLRVVDASIMPGITNGYAQGPVYGIAEKASAMILKEWAKHSGTNFQS